MANIRDMVSASLDLYRDSKFAHLCPLIPLYVYN